VRRTHHYNSGRANRLCGVLLNGRLEAHGVDGERLARKALDDALRARGAYLRPHEYEDALSFLLVAFWETSEKWDPARGGNFATHTYRLLRLRLVDWYRSELGRTKWTVDTYRRETGRQPKSYEREQPRLFSLDAHDSGGDRLDEPLGAGASDPADDRDSDLRGLLTRGDRQRAQDLDELGLEPPGRAA
jgi:hypothetical protein